MDVFNMGKHIGSRYQFSFALLRDRGASRLPIHEGDQRGDVAMVGYLAGLRGLDTEDRSARAKVAQQCSVIGTDVHDQVGRAQRIKSSNLARKVREIITQDFRRSAG